MNISRLLISLLLLCFVTHSYGASIVISHKSPESIDDRRESYNTELIALALEKSKAKFGDYKMVAVPPMNTARSLYAASANIYPNFLTELSYLDSLSDNPELTYINFPVDLGITGYRICFVNPSLKERIKKITHVNQLKKYTFGQGIGWADTLILRHNGFKVIEIQNYDSMFKMVAVGRIDFYCRGVNELQKEYKAYRYITRLTYDESFVLAYTLPRFYYLGAGNKEAKERIEAGLYSAYHDGSLLKLWHKNNDESLKFAKLKKRKIFKLENPYIKNLSPDFKKYYIDPLN